MLIEGRASADTGMVDTYVDSGHVGDSGMNRRSRPTVVAGNNNVY